MHRNLMILTAITALALPTLAGAADSAAGKATFVANCSSCHGVTGKGDGPVGAALPISPRDFSKGDFKFDTDKDGKIGTDADLKAVVQQGGAAFGGSALMAPWPSLSDGDIANIIAYIRTLKE
ncbi:MAG: cytochrome c [Myxococcota bacterium]